MTLSRLDLFLNRQAAGIRAFVVFYLIVFCVLSLAPLFFLNGAGYSPDSAHFLNQVNFVVDALQGKISWKQAAILGHERSYAFQLPIGLIAEAVHIYSPHFYVLLYWLFYVAPVPFLIWRLCILRGGHVEWYAALLPLVFFADPALIRLAGFAFFTEVPSFTLCFASFVLAYEVFSREAVRYRLIKLGFAALFLALGLASRLHTSLPILLPAYTAFLVWTAWPPTAAKWKNLALFIGLGVVCTLLIALATKLWIPFLTSLKLAGGFSNTIWKYGNGAAEMGMQNVYLERFAYYGFGILVSYFVLLVTALCHAWRSSRREIWLIAFLVGFSLYQTLLWTATLPINSRYITSFAFFALIFVVLKPAQLPVMRYIASIVILFFAFDGIWALTPQAMNRENTLSDARLNLGRRLGYGTQWDNKLYSLNGARYSIPYEDIIAAAADYRMEKKLDTLQFFFINPYQSILQNIDLRFVLPAYRLGNPDAYASQNRLDIVSDYISEFRNPDIYLDFLKRYHMPGFLTANLVMVMDPKGMALFDYAKGWTDYDILRDMIQPALAGEAGLRPLRDFYVRDRQDGMAVREHALLFEVADVEKWRSYVRAKFCTGAHRELLAPYCLDYKPVANLTPFVDADSLGTDLKLYADVSGKHFMFGVKLVEPDMHMFRRIFLRFNANGPSCPVFRHDFDVFVLKEWEVFSEIDRREAEKILACRASVAIGGRHRWLEGDLFSVKDYKEKK